LQGSGFNQNNRPDTTGSNCNAGENGRQILNPAAFTLIGYTIGTVGTAARGYCFGPNYRNVDMQLAKNWTFKERFNIKFALDFFNLFNHANFIASNLETANFSASGLLCGPSQTACTPTNNVVSAQQGTPNSISSGFGQANNVQPGREIQYSLKFTF
jgi:hypothetical protein